MVDLVGGFLVAAGLGADFFASEAFAAGVVAFFLTGFFTGALFVARFGCVIAFAVGCFLAGEDFLAIGRLQNRDSALVEWIAAAACGGFASGHAPIPQL
jgi:dolichol kinase